MWCRGSTQEVHDKRKVKFW